MDGPIDSAGGRGRGGRGRGGLNENPPTRGNVQAGRGQHRGPPRGGFFGGTGIQQAILRGMARGDARVRNPGGGFGTTGALNEAAGREKGWGGGYDEIRVRGLQGSKAASNRDGGVSDLLAFLERKANGPDTKPGDAVRIRKVCLSLRFNGHQTLRNVVLSGPLSFQAKFIKRRPRNPTFAAVTFG
jgi:nuclear RNA export factor